MTDFTKTGAGWAFEVEGVAFEAVRNVAGFAHRDWDLYRDGQVVSDQLASRGECVEEARAWVAMYRTWQI